MSKESLYKDSPIGVCVIKRGCDGMRALYTNKAFGSADALTESADGQELFKKLQSAKPPTHYTLHLDKRWYQITIQQSTYEDEDAFILWASDISATKETESVLKKAIEKADAMAEMKSNFLATMSHEIRTPMQSVYGLLELIGEEKPDEKIMAMVKTAKESGSGLLEILDDILDFAKMDANKMELDEFEVPVRTLVRGINEAMDVKVRGNNVQLLDDIDEDVPFVVVGDPKRLRQIIMNLTGNALKFTHEGTVTLHVSKGGQHVKDPKKGLVLRFEIIDSGIGMKQEIADTLFQPFTQADNSTSRKYGGTGLGLSICNKLVGLMGGKIGVTSTPDKGSVFWFEIPTEEVSTDAAANLEDMPNLEGISVISVEDHPQGAKEIVRSMESMGATVESCPTYKEALELVKQRPFDVGIIDQGLPDGLGLDLIREIMDLRPFMGIVMYTVRDDVGLSHSLNSLGATYLTKPASRRGLGEAVLDTAGKVTHMHLEGPQKLLIAEDTPSVVDVLQRQLDKLGVEADFVENGQQALDALETGEYGIILTDLHMPGVDGYEVVKTIRQQEKDGGDDKRFPVIVLTADVQMTQRQTYLGHGFDECLLKPVSLGQFKRLLIRWGLMEEEYKISDTKADKTEQSPENDGKPPAVDIEKMKQQMGAFDDSTIQMLHMFIDMTQSVIDEIKLSLENNDYPRLGEAAHSLKGGARSACCNVLGDIAGQLQDEAAEQKDTCAQLVQDIESEFIRAGTEIKNLKAT